MRIASLCVVALAACSYPEPEALPASKSAGYLERYAQQRALFEAAGRKATHHCRFGAAHCGRYNVLTDSDGFTGTSLFYRPDGILVARGWWSDDGQPDVYEGPDLLCKVESDGSLCPNVRR